jgi:hypothetical protein
MEILLSVSRETLSSPKFSTWHPISGAPVHAGWIARVITRRRDLLTSGLPRGSADQNTPAEDREPETNEQHEIDDVRRPIWRVLTPGTPWRPDDKTQDQQHPEEDLHD